MDELLARLIDHDALTVIRDALFEAGIDDVALVGGTVRDALRGIATFEDLDLTCPAGPETVAEALSEARRAGAPIRGVNLQGAAFGVIACVVDTDAGTEKVEVTRHRTEVYESGSRDPKVAAARDLTEDLARRDFTVNAVALRLPSPGGRFTPELLVDPFDGAGDLTRKLLRCPGDVDQTLTDDPLRIVRALRFAAKLGFSFDAALEAGIIRHRARLVDRAPDGSRVVSVERVRDEVDKAMTDPTHFGRLVADTVRFGLDEAVFCGLAVAPLVGMPFERLDGRTSLLAATLVATGTSGETALRAAKRTNDDIGQASAVAAVVDVLAGSPDLVALRHLVRRTRDLTLDRGVTIAELFGKLDGPTAGRLQTARRDAELLRRELVNGRDVIAAGVPQGPSVGAVLTAVSDALCADPHLTRTAALEIVAASSS